MSYYDCQCGIEDEEGLSKCRKLPSDKYQGRPPLPKVTTKFVAKFDRCFTYTDLVTHFANCDNTKCPCEKYYSGTVFEPPTLYRLHDDFVFDNQSSLPPPPNVTIDMMTPMCEKEETMCFENDDMAPMYAVDSVMDITRSLPSYTDATLGDFLKRPVRIASLTWGTAAGSFFQDINPWTLFYTDPAVANKIKNYYLLRSSLKVKFTIDGGPFFYGKMLVSYTPLHNNSTIENNRSGVPQDLIAASQRPHLTLDPCTSTGGTLHLPFLFQKDYMYALTSFAEWNNIGSINVRTLANLKHANGAVATLTINMYAWAEDVELCIPTAQSEIVFDNQSRAEYGKGILSKPLTAAANVAGQMGQIISIKPYAKATQMVLTGLGQWASLLGFSRPAVLSDIAVVRTMPQGFMATCDRPEAVQKLSLDSKQEITVDPRVVGLSDKDDMSLLAMAQHESYLTQFDWTVAASTDAILYSTAVQPTQMDKNGAFELHMTPMMYASLPFLYWRGTINFRFVIVASAHHKGRLRVTYDPYNPVQAPTNVNYTRIIDIAQTKDFTIPVSWCQSTTFAAVDGNLLPRFTGGALQGNDPFRYNGILTLFVANTLTVPNSTAANDIKVLVYVSAGPDFELASPTSQTTDSLSVFTNQSAMEVTGVDPGATAQKSDNLPIGEEFLSGIGEIKPIGSIYDVYFGEKVSSIRYLLKRYTNFAIVFTPTTSRTAATTYLWALSFPSFPFAYGYDPSGTYTTTGAKLKPFNPVNQTMLSYFSLPFLMRRGGTRWKCQVNANPSTISSTMTNIRGTGYAGGTAAKLLNVSTALTIGGPDAMGVQANNFAGSNWDGLASGSVRDGFGTEVEVPYYNNVRFDFCRRPAVPAGAQFNYLSTELRYTYTSTSDPPPSVQYYCAAAEDLSFHFFVSIPVMFSYPMSTLI
jgi:hypothetical protein